MRPFERRLGVNYDSWVRILGEDSKHMSVGIHSDDPQIHKSPYSPYDAEPMLVISEKIRKSVEGTIIRTAHPSSHKRAGCKRAQKSPLMQVC